MEVPPINMKSMCVLEWSAALAGRFYEGVKPRLQCNRSSPAAGWKIARGSRHSVSGTKRKLSLGRGALALSVQADRLMGFSALADGHSPDSSSDLWIKFSCTRSS
jgi:hypothetical protein